MVESDAQQIEKNTGMSTYPTEILRANLDRFSDNRPGPEEQLIAAESAWLAIPPWRRPRNFSTALIGIDLIWTDRVIGYIPQPLTPCPACHDHPIGRCLVCSASNDDPVRWPMMPRKERLKILAGPPLRKQVTATKTRREQRAVARRMTT